MSSQDLRSDMRIRDVMARFPATHAVFARHRMGCCEGTHTIAVAALARGLDPDLVMAEVLQAADGSA